MPKIICGKARKSIWKASFAPANGDRDGNDRYTTEVYVGRFRGELVLLDRREGGGSAGDYGSRDSAPRAAAASSQPPAFDDMDDDVPF